MNISAFGAFILVYEALATICGLPTWTRLTEMRSPKALPVWVFLLWLGLHLILALGRRGVGAQGVWGVRV